MGTDRSQVDLSVKKDIYDQAMKKLKKLQKKEREQYGVKRTDLADIGRAAIMAYRPGDGRAFAPRVLRSNAGAKPKRQPFRFELATKAYERQKDLITINGHRVTQVVEEALVAFTETGAIPAPPRAADA